MVVEEKSPAPVDNVKAGHVLVHGNLFFDDVLFEIKILITQSRPHELCPKLDYFGQVFRQGRCVIDGIFFTGKSVVISAGSVECLVDFERPEFLGAFEQHMLEEV